jgi:hypothetical protein
MWHYQSKMKMLPTISLVYGARTGASLHVAIGYISHVKCKSLRSICALGRTILQHVSHISFTPQVENQEFLDKCTLRHRMMV